jgi:4-diphosphocytidyl-2-C-methyl-D-erythritol kinase
LGSDCPLFLHDGPVVIRGRGERVDPLAPEAVARLAGRRVLVFKPAFAVNTAWAYRQLATMAAAARAGDPPLYLPPAEAEARLADWHAHPEASAEDLAYNSLEPAVFDKFVALPTLLEQLHQRQGWRARMSGSGSACFGFVAEEAATEPLTQEIQDAWGVTAFLVMARLAGPMALNPG